MKRESWQATGPNRPIKVCPAEWTIDIHLGGYITVGKYLIGKTPKDIERDLGHPKDSLVHGTRIYKFTRPPQPSEFDYRLTADHPDGFADEGCIPQKDRLPAGKPEDPSVEDRRSPPASPSRLSRRTTLSAPASYSAVTGCRKR